MLLQLRHSHPDDLHVFNHRQRDKAVGAHDDGRLIEFGVVGELDAQLVTATQTIVLVGITRVQRAQLLRNNRAPQEEGDQFKTHPTGQQWFLKRATWSDSLWDWMYSW